MGEFGEGEKWHREEEKWGNLETDVTVNVMRCIVSDHVWHFLVTYIHNTVHLVSFGFFSENLRFF